MKFEKIGKIEPIIKDGKLQALSWKPNKRGREILREIEEKRPRLKTSIGFKESKRIGLKFEKAAGKKLKRCIKTTYIGHGKTARCPARTEYGNYCPEHRYGDNAFLPKPNDGESVKKS